MKVLLTGGTGLLGRALIPSLLGQGDQVSVLSRNPSGVNLPREVEVTAWDGKTPRGWEEKIENTDVVINLAGESIGASRWTDERKAKIIASRTQAGNALVAAIHQAAKKPQVLVQASGIGAYGPGGDRVLDETGTYGNDFLASVTREWEASTLPVEELGVRRVVIRTGLVMTRNGGWMPSLLLAYRLFVGGPMGSGKQWWPWIHIEDYVGGLLFLLQRPEANGVINLVGPNPCRMEEFGRTLAGVLKRPYWLPTPAFGLQLVLGEMSTLILDGQRAIPVKLVEYGYSYRYARLQPALEDLFG